MKSNFKYYGICKTSKSTRTWFVPWIVNLFFFETFWDRFYVPGHQLASKVFFFHRHLPPIMKHTSQNDWRPQSQLWQSKPQKSLSQESQITGENRRWPCIKTPNLTIQCMKLLSQIFESLGKEVAGIQENELKGMRNNSTILCLGGTEFLRVGVLIAGMLWEIKGKQLVKESKDV